MSKRFRKLSHTIYECKYHLIFCPKYRYRVLTDEVREYTRGAIEKLVKQKEGLEIIEMNVQADHVHLAGVDTAEAFGFKRDGIFERKVSDPNFAKGVKN